MPTYAYRCKSCSHEFEEFQGISEPALVRCPSCGKDTLSKMISGGAGLVFKGSGFYLTDYKNTSSSSGDGEKKPSPPKETSETKSESKSADSKSTDSKSGDAKPAESKSTESRSSGGSGNSTKSE